MVSNMEGNELRFKSQISNQGKQKVIFIPKTLSLMIEDFDNGVEVTIRDTRGDKEK